MDEKDNWDIRIAGELIIVIMMTVMMTKKVIIAVIIAKAVTLICKTEKDSFERK